LVRSSILLGSQGKKKKVQLCFHISLSQNAYPDLVVPLHLDIICRWVVGVMKVVVGSSCPTMFRGKLKLFHHAEIYNPQKIL
jgi:hypothetical protein